MAKALGVHLLPSTGEFTYDTVAYQGATSGASFKSINAYGGGGTTTTDFQLSLAQLQAAHPECNTVSMVVSWFFDSETAGACRVYPSTNFINGAFLKWSGSAWVADHWRCSGLTEQASGLLIPIPTLSNGGAAYGGTPSDQSVVRCIQALKAAGFRVIFYPFLLGTGAGFPWRGRITYSPDVSNAATAAVTAFVGSAAPSQFTRDATNLTVSFSGAPSDWTYRRMVLHYANLCVIAGGIDLFVIGSELRGLETIRGPGWTEAGTTDPGGKAVWDYPFVAGLVALANDVRSVFDGANLTKDLTGLHNLITYSADWSCWMGFQHPGQSGQWPHLDQLWASSNIDLVALDNYLPLTDWTTGDGGLDALNWSAPVYGGPWPPPATQLNGLGLSTPTTIDSSAYLKANIEGGQYFNWYYNDGTNGGRGLDPLGSAQMVSLPEGDRLAQARNPYGAGQQILANKQFRWWWNNTHQAVYDTGSGWAPQGPATEWVPQSKPIAFLEYGFAAVDKATNQPNVFFDAKSSESATPYWSIWDPAPGLSYLPRRDDTIAGLALEAVYEYWVTDGHNETSGAGVPLVQSAFCCVWAWDARPFPTFPDLSSVWSDSGNWAAGDWSNGLRQSLPPPPPSPSPSIGGFPTFPVVQTLGCSVHMRPRFVTEEAAHVSGRSTRRPRYAVPLYDIALTYELLRADAAHQELQDIAGFFAAMSGEGTPFWFAPPSLSDLLGQAIGTANGTTTVFPLIRSIGALYSEPIAGTSGVTAVYVNGVSQTSGWSVSTGYAPAISFAIAPAAGTAITADFNILFLCRFAEDVQDLEEFMAMLFTLRTLKLQTVRP